MSHPGFRHLIQSPNRAPRWLRESVLGRYMWSIGLTMDVGTEWLHQGIVQRLPQQCDESALSWLGRARRIIRGAAETSDSFRGRLLRWRSAWKRAGNAFGILEQVQGYFSPAAPTVRLVTGDTVSAQWWTRNEDGTEEFYKADPSNWDWDSLEPGQTPITGQRRFWIIIYQPSDEPNNLFTALGNTSSQRPDTCRGADALTAQIQDIFNIADRFKQAGTWCAGIIVSFSDAQFPPGGSGTGLPQGNWYRYSDPVTYLPVRVRDAEYFIDRRRPGLFQEDLEAENGYP